MSNEEPQEDRSLEIPDNAIFVRPSSWAWGWFALPFAILGVVSVFFDGLTRGVIPIILAVIVILPRFLRWRSTVYILTDDYVMIRLGAARNQRVDLLISQISDIQENPGVFGRTLGYAAVHLKTKDERVAVLPHVPYRSPLVEHIRSRMDTSALPDNEPTY